MTDERPKELCCECQAETGRAGRDEDSLYVDTPTGERGPFCQSCCDMLTIGPAVAAETKISVVSFTGRIDNARAMADNIIKTPASEQNITHIQTFAAQAIRDLTDAVEDLNARMPVRSAPTAAGGEKYLHCIICEAAIDDETVDRNLERCDDCAAAGKTDENGYPDAKTIAENRLERQGAGQQIDRLASYIQSLGWGEPRQPDEGAGDCAIRIIGTMYKRMGGLERESLDLYPGKRKLAGRIIYYLNSLAETDREAIRELFDTRIPCNVKFAEHPTLQVRRESAGWKFGILGILNGFVGTDVEGNGLIQRIVDDEDAARIEFCVAPE